jgi:hypothetical membrane protein
MSQKHPAENRAELVRAGAFSGILAPVLFTTLVVIESLLRPGYNQISDEISYLGVGPYEIIQNMNFVICGILSIVLAFGLAAALSTRNRKVKSLRSAIILFGIGLILAGVTLLLASRYPESSSTAIQFYYLHTFASFVAFLSILVSQFLLWRILKESNSRDWGNFDRLSLTCGILSAAFLAIFILTLVSNFVGLTERMFAAACLIWIELSGVKLVTVGVTQEHENALRTIGNNANS